MERSDNQPAASCVLLAGRRPDAEDAQNCRFPIANALLVRERIRTLFDDRRPGHLVCSAACGADLLALDVAGDFGVKRHVVLPFAVSIFRDVSVTDRPGFWGPLFDRLVADVEREGRLAILGEAQGSDEAFEAVNDALLQTAQALSADVLAVAVWEGNSRGKGDLTEHLLDTASRVGIETTEILTR